MIRERTCLYRFYDAVGALLYVGVTNRPDIRFAQHAADKPWWPEVRRITKEWYDVRECVSELVERGCRVACAGHAEIVAIRRELPRYNIEHNMSNPHRVRYVKRGAQARSVRRRRQRRTQHLTGSQWAWVVVCVAVLVLFTSVGPSAGLLGVGGVLASRYAWKRHVRPTWRALTQRR